MKYAFIKDQRDRYSIKAQCSVFGVSRRGYYSWLKRPTSATTLKNKHLLKEIKLIFHEYREVYGAPRIHKELVESGFWPA